VEKGKTVETAVEESEPAGEIERSAQDDVTSKDLSLDILMRIDLNEEE